MDENGRPTFADGDDPSRPNVQEYRARKWSHSNPQTQDTNQKTPDGP